MSARPPTGPHVWGDRLPTLQAPRVTLRWLTERDLPDLYTVFSDPHVMRYWSTLPWAAREEADHLLADIQRLFAERTLFQWGVALREEDRVIGTCTLFHLDASQWRGEIGYALAHAHWGVGLGTEAVTALVDFAFNTLGLHRLEADADPRNERSLRLLERMGFAREGYLRERYSVGSEIQDAVLLGLLRARWEQERSQEDLRPRGQA
jgi:ribosomal-protein-alanine N-acetyltransferase